jgi:hypothetical protein
MLALRLWLGDKIYGSVGIFGTRISPNRMVKYTGESEVEAHRYVAANTTIPIPRLHGVHKHRGHLALEMKFLPGCETLQRCWKGFTDVQKQALVDEISGYIKQLRDLEPPNPTRVSSTDGNACRQIRVGSVKRFGPFDDASGLHTLVRGGWDLERSKQLFGEQVVRVH